MVQRKQGHKNRGRAQEREQLEDPVSTVVTGPRQMVKCCGKMLQILKVNEIIGGKRK